MSSTNSNPPSKPSESSPTAFEDILVSLIALSAVFTAICLIRCFLRQMAARRMSLSFANKRYKNRLDSAAIAALPTFAYKSDVADHACYASSAMECSICLNGVQEGEMVKLLPRCKHSFHGSCVDLWLKDHSTCPICRMEVLESASVTKPPGQIEMEELDIENQSYNF